MGHPCGRPTFLVFFCSSADALLEEHQPRITRTTRVAHYDHFRRSTHLTKKLRPVQTTYIQDNYTMDTQNEPYPVPTSPKFSEGEEGEVQKTRRPERSVSVDPRTVAFTIGKKKANLRAIATQLEEAHGETVFLKYVTPPGELFGFWKNSL